ncbi:6231_t:CDS:2 [Dentiscutata heterogama]|uniref:6231_t:CDS:1 n=1 Tax=Dentiscutata heterogama TaxID=1316150 RepID=A0ACA9L1L9_9GLOM|nr:6231_t:CDS:2 [Dentiscutata heterogama]
MDFRLYKKLMALKHDLGLKNKPQVSNVVQLNLDFKNNPLLLNVARNIALSKNLIVIARAGISCSGGIPDFRSSNDLFEMIKQKYQGTFSSVRDLFDSNLHITDEAVEAFYNFMAQVVQLHGTLANLQCNVCTNVYSFTQEYCDIFTKVEIPNCPKCEERVILYGDKHLKELKIEEIAAYNKNKADCLIIMGTSLRIPRVKCLIKIFAKAVHDRNGYVIMVNATNVVTKEWNGIIDYQIIGTCDEWVKLVNMELSSTDLWSH